MTIYRHTTGSDFNFNGAPIYRKNSVITKENVEISAVEQEVVTIVHGVVETTNIAKIGDYIITGPMKERYVIKAEKFPKLYVEKDGVYISTNRRRVIQLTEAIELKVSWGTQTALAGGFITQSINDPSDIYLIDEQVFYATYIVDEQ